MVCGRIIMVYISAGGVMMDILKIVLYIIFVIDCIALSAINPFTGRQVCGAGNDQRHGGHILGTE